MYISSSLDHIKQLLHTRMMTQKAEGSPAAAAVLTCNGTDALLQVKYTITEDEWDKSRVGVLSPLLSIKGISSQTYETFANLTDYQACLPTDECSEVVVGGLPTDGYKLSFDGKAVDIGQAFPFDGKNPATSTEVGTCTKPICKDVEALLQVQYWIGGKRYSSQSYRVEDKNGNTIHQGEEPAGPYSLNNTYACLPKDVLHVPDWWQNSV